VTASKKVLVATIIVAAGYGVAALVGRPDAIFPPPAALSRDGAPDRQPIVTAPADVPAAAADSDFMPGTARLVPDTSSDAVVPFAAPENDPQASQPTVDLDDAESVAAAPISGDLASTPARNPATIARSQPRAMLLDEAPRPIAAEPNLPSTLGRLQQVADVAHVQHTERSTAARNGFTRQTPAELPGDAITVHDKSFTPSPFPAAVDADEPRSHIVVDGDSLAKLAGRYLDDPRRADEIYQLNRHQLTNPELLPIGVELAIPSRTAADADDENLPQSMLPRTVASHRRATAGLVPVRPIPHASRVVPRAFLAPPRPINE
jgi:nucleoid-associated protein YgaU